MDIAVVGKGIEEPQQLELLQRAGCSHGQGYLLGRPSPSGAARRPGQGPLAALRQAVDRWKHDPDVAGPFDRPGRAGEEPEPATRLTPPAEPAPRPPPALSGASRTPIDDRPPDHQDASACRCSAVVAPSCPLVVLLVFSPRVRAVGHPDRCRADALPRPDLRRHHHDARTSTTPRPSTSRVSPSTCASTSTGPPVTPSRSGPLIVFVHGGSFRFGNRTSPEIVDEATTFARMGYVTASISYRLSANGCSSAIPTNECLLAITHARDDAQDAVAFLRANASTYGIDTSRIAIAGTSAGAITAVNVAFSNEVDPMSQVRAAVSLSGASILTTPNPGDAPVFLLHGTADFVVPYQWAVNTRRRRHRRRCAGRADQLPGRRPRALPRPPPGDPRPDEELPLLEARPQQRRPLIGIGERLPVDDGGAVEHRGAVVGR